ncbi:MAG: nucleotide exchange factor GrpE [Patulibacter minatonensis]
MSTEHEPEQPTSQAGADAPEASAQAGTQAAPDESTASAAAAPDESAAEAAVAVDEQPAAEPEVDPLEGKTDDEIRTLAAQAGEYLSLAQRGRADFDNYRKRAQRDLAAAKVRGSVDLARELLPAIDNAERALEHEAAALAAAGDAADEHATRLLGALRALHDELIASLGRGGVERFDPTGEPFDPVRHDAMAKRPAGDGEASGICSPVYQAGYAAGDEVIRPARVVVTE